MAACTVGLNADSVSFDMAFLITQGEWNGACSDVASIAFNDSFRVAERWGRATSLAGWLKHAVGESPNTTFEPGLPPRSDAEKG